MAKLENDSGMEFYGGTTVVLTKNMIKTERDRLNQKIQEKELEHLRALENRREKKKLTAQKIKAEEKVPTQQREEKSDEISALGVALAGLSILHSEPEDYNRTSAKEETEAFAGKGGKFGGGGASGGWEPSENSVELVSEPIESSGDAGGGTGAESGE